MLLIAQRGGLLVILALDSVFLLRAQLRRLLVKNLNLGRGGHPLNAQASARLINQVNGLIRQESVGNIACRQVHGSLDRLVGNGYAVVSLVLIAHTLENLHGEVLGRLVHLNWLEAAFQCGVLLNVLAVLVQGGGTDGLQLAASQHRLQDGCSVDSALCGTGTDEGVNLVNEQDNVAAGANLLEHLLEAFLKVTAVPGSRDQGSQIQGVQVLIFESFGDIAVYDGLRQALNDGGFADTGFTDKHGVVLGAA